jgi:hypothetical protein
MGLSSFFLFTQRISTDGFAKDSGCKSGDVGEVPGIPLERPSAPSVRRPCFVNNTHKLALSRTIGAGNRHLFRSGFVPMRAPQALGAGRVARQKAVLTAMIGISYIPKGGKQ